MFKILFGLVAALLFSGAAHASIPATSQVGYNCGYAPGFHPTVEAAFAGWGGMGTAAVSGPYEYNSGSCIASIWGNPSVVSNGTTSTIYTCPSNSTLSGAVCNCNAGYNENAGMCVNAQCEVGKGKTVNVTVGWSRTPNYVGNDVVVDYGPPSQAGFNDGVCVGDLGLPSDCYVSQAAAANGLYRLSCDFPMVFTGESTSSGDPNADPQTPPPACPGFVGTVNDKPVCVGTASSPLPPGTARPNLPTVAGNPSSGQQPSTGPGAGTGGAGRTPLVGSGGNDGGPSTAAVRPPGVGPAGEPTEPGNEVCGAAPLPACNVKVDETGVPAEGTAPGRFTQGNTDVDTVRTDAQGAIDDAAEALLPDWSWTFSLPTGCSPYPLEAFGFDLDVCQFQPIIHDLMSMLWLAAGVFGLVNLFRTTVGA